MTRQYDPHREWAEEDAKADDIAAGRLPKQLFGLLEALVLEDENQAASIEDLYSKIHQLTYRLAGLAERLDALEGKTED